MSIMAASHTTEKTLTALKERGISSQHVAIALGGQYHYDRFLGWMHTRTLVEASGSSMNRQQPRKESILPAIPVGFQFVVLTKIDSM